jgi:hypothetical protein
MRAFAQSAATYWRVTMMINPRVWWASKSTAKRQNWFALSLLFAFAGACVVEVLVFWGLLGMLPGVGLVWLEISE